MIKIETHSHCAIIFPAILKQVNGKLRGKRVIRETIERKISNFIALPGITRPRRVFHSSHGAIHWQRESPAPLFQPFKFYAKIHIDTDLQDMPGD